LIGSDAAARAYDQRHRLADIMLLRQSQEAVDKVGRDLAGEFKAFPKDAPTRFRKILDEMLFDVQHWAATYYSQWITDPTKFCLSPEWMTWHEIRLLKAVFVEYTYLRQTSCAPSRENAEHDYQDMEYVLLLSRADAIITRDKKLVEPLARAAFPEKDVFSSLEDVPESYRCDWTNP
jgi:hypothetical protein